MTGKAGDEKWGAAEVTSGAPEITPLKLKQARLAMKNGARLR